MVRWRWSLALALLLLLPTILGKRNDDDDDDERQEPEEDDDDEDEDDEDAGEEKNGEEEEQQQLIPSRRSAKGPAVPEHELEHDHEIVHVRTVNRGPQKRRPLECYVCAYKSETPLRACLDPTKFRVHTITCHSADDRCFTSVTSRNDTYEAVTRGCRSACVGSSETTCCVLNRCNNQAFAIPLIQQREAPETTTPKPKPQPLNKSSGLMPPSLMFFVTILLILQTVSKVACI